MKFEWNPGKNQSNLEKHGVDFEEARTVFDDVLAVIIDDRFHSTLEKREIIVGLSSRYRLLYVVFTEKKNYVRIISARQLTSAEKRRYEQGQFDQ